jgi:hypothetical protein
VGIPAKANADSGGNANGIPGRRRKFSERSDAGTSIVQEVFGFVKKNLSGAQRRSAAASEERGAGKGRHVLSPPQHAWARRALARRLCATTLLAHGIAAHLDAMGVVNQAVKDAVGSGGITNLFVPARDGEL